MLAFRLVSMLNLPCPEGWVDVFLRNQLTAYTVISQILLKNNHCENLKSYCLHLHICWHTTYFNHVAKTKHNEEREDAHSRVNCSLPSLKVFRIVKNVHVNDSACIIEPELLRESSSWRQNNKNVALKEPTLTQSFIPDTLCCLR
jgi:hypothetical protein